MYRFMYLLLFLTGNRQYMIPWARIGTPRWDHIDNLEAEKKLMDWLEEQLRGWESSVSARLM